MSGDVPVGEGVWDHRTIEADLARGLAEARTLAEAAPRLLRGLSERVGCDAAELWGLGPDSSEATRVGSWMSSASPSTQDLQGSGPGDAVTSPTIAELWRGGRPLWCPDLAAHPGLSAIAKGAGGLRSALAWPIGLHGQLGGLLFFGRDMAAPDGQLQRLLDHTAGQIAQFIERIRTDEALRTSEERLRKVVDAAPVIVFAFDAEGVITFTAGHGLHALGLGPGESVGRNATEMYAHNPAAVAEIRRALQGEEFTGLVEEAGLVLETRWTPIRRPDGSLGGTTGVAVDVTARRRAQDELVQQEERFRYVTMATRDAIYDWEVQTGRLWRNETFQSTFPAAERVGAGEVWWKEHIHPDDSLRVARSIEAAFRERSSSWSGEYRLCRRDGHYASIIDRGYVLYDRGGRAERMIGAITDVSERTLAEALRAGQSRVLEVIARDAPLDEILATLCRFIEAQSDGVACSVLLLDADGVHVRHGAAPSLPPSYVRSFDGAAIGPQRGSCGAAMHSNRTVIVTDVLSDPLWQDHRDLALTHGLRACWATPIADHQGKVLGSFAMYYREPRSPTRAEMELIELAARLGGIALERKRASDQLHASLQEKEVLLKEIHHRVKNNLQIITSLLALQADRVGDRRILEALTESQNRVRAMALVHEALYRSGDLAHVRFSAHAESLCAHLFRSYNVPSRIHLEMDVPDVGLDLDRAIPCGLIINELVSNAIKHAFPDERRGRVLVRLQALPEGRYALTIADDGIGLRHDVDPFRSDTLGLQLVADLTEQLGAQLTLDREHGTTFTLRFSDACQSHGSGGN